MHTAPKFAIVLSAVVFFGCTSHRSESISWNGRSILPRGESVASLNIIANDFGRSRADRARAIFTLFAYHMQPGFSAVQVHGVLTDTNWMGDVNLYGVYALGGWVPVEMTFEDTVFCLHLFPVDADKHWSPWVIYFRLSGTTPEGPGRPAEEALAFLHGDTTLRGNPKLVEFALCYPGNQPSVTRRCERFSSKGIHVYEGD